MKTSTPLLNESPDVMPVLSPGKHRNPRQGACFMEFASYLAGERWSDHPVCTHPLLAFLARGINDFSSDEARSRLVPLIPAVIGLNSSDPQLDVMIALRSAACALPVASESRQRALATGILSCERMLDDLGVVPDAATELRLRSALAQAPQAWEWAQEFESLRGLHKRSMSFTRAGRAIVSTAVLGIAQACVDNADERLYKLLTLTIEDVKKVLGTVPPRTVANPAEVSALPVLTY